MGQRSFLQALVTLGARGDHALFASPARDLWRGGSSLIAKLPHVGPKASSWMAPLVDPSPTQPRPDPMCMLRATFPVLAASPTVVQHPTWASAPWAQLLPDVLHSQADSLEAGLGASLDPPWVVVCTHKATD